MNQYKYYYRFGSLAIDNFDENDIKKHNQELNSFDDLSNQFEILKNAYETLSNEHTNLMVCVIPSINEVVEISVHHKAKRKLFSKEVKENKFSICITMGNINKISLYFYETTNLDEVKQIFYNYIINQQIPNVSNWKVEHCGGRFLQ